MQNVLRCGVLAVAVLLGSMAHGHFLWVGVEPDANGQPTAHVWFGEGAEPGEGELIKNITKSKVWVRSASRTGPELKLSEVQYPEKKTAALTAPVSDASWQCVEASCDYGVIARGGAPFLLQYYAKHLRAASAKELESVTPSEALPLDIIPHVLDDGKVQVTALWKGKPTGEVQIIGHHPDGDGEELTVNAEGQASFTPKGQGLVGFRARYVESDKGGEREGQKYQEARHYTTLTLALPQNAATKQVGSAVEVLKKARDARGVWSNFPGFTAQLVATVDNNREECRVKVAADGEITFDGPAVTDESALRALTSLINHRMAGSEETEEATFAEEQSVHPLGRLIKEANVPDSALRVQGDLLSEINRYGGETKFTIRMLEVTPNIEGKLMPHVYTVSFWDSASGKLKSTSTSINTWTRVGKFDLPSKVLTVSSQDNGANVRSLEFSDHKLLASVAAVSAK